MPQTPLKALYGLCLSEVELAEPELLKLKSETSNLINICQALKEDNPDETTLQTLARNQILEIHTQGIVVHFTGRAQKMLSLVAWYFDPLFTSITSGLLRFLSRPGEQLYEVCTHIYPHCNFSKTFEHFEETLRLFLERLPLLVFNGLERLDLEV